MQSGIRAPISPLRGSTDPDIAAGRQLFTQANCQSCHGGPQWTSSRVRFNPPPDASLISNGQMIAELRNVGTFNAQLFNEVRQNGAPAIGADGFAPPSLLSLFAFPQTFFHGGAANSLDAVMHNVAHRSAGTGTDILQDSAKRAQLIKFLLSIDASTPPIAPNPATKLTVTSAAWNIGAKVAPDSLASGYGTGLATQAGAPVYHSSTGDVQRHHCFRSGRFRRLATRTIVLCRSGPGELCCSHGNKYRFRIVTVTSGSGATATATLDISAVAPSVFTMPGGSVAAAVAVRATAVGRADSSHHLPMRLRVGLHEHANRLGR